MLCGLPAAFQQHKKIKVYDTGAGFRVRKDVHARNLRWTVTDTDISPSEQFLAYSSITPAVHVVRKPSAMPINHEPMQVLTYPGYLHAR